jgi:hypothetical protein
MGVMSDHEVRALIDAVMGNGPLCGVAVISALDPPMKIKDDQVRARGAQALNSFCDKCFLSFVECPADI